MLPGLDLLVQISEGELPQHIQIEHLGLEVGNGGRELGDGAGIVQGDPAPDRDAEPLVKVRANGIIIGIKIMAAQERPQARMGSAG